MAQNLTDFDLGLLLALEALLAERNVTHAAARLNMTQSALSARLTRLRHLLNDPLLIPAASGRGMVPTPHALALQPELARLIERLRDFVNAAHVFDPATSPRVFRIAVSDNPAAVLAPALVARMRVLAPGVQLALTLPDKPRVAQQMEAGEIDLFIGAAEDADGALIGRVLFQDHFLTAQRAGHPRGTGPLTLEEFCAADHLIVSSAGGRFSGMVDETLAEIGAERRVAVSVQSYALAPLVLAGSACLCTLPARFLSQFTPGLELYEPPFALPPFAMMLFWHPRMRTDAGHSWLRRQLFALA